MKVCACAVITVEGGLAGGERGESSVLREREIEREGDIERERAGRKREGERDE